MLGAFKILSDTGTFWMPPQASTYAASSDWLFWFIMWISVFFFLLVAGLVAIFSWKYRYRPGVAQLEAPRHSTALELTWTFIPTVIVVVIFVYGFKGYMNLAVPPANARDIVVEGSMWKWSFTYENGYSDGDLHMVTGVPVRFTLHSSDVIHGFYVPAFRVKKDVVPGRYNSIWVTPNQPGEYDVFCTQYCGLGHSTMRAMVVVQSQAEFDAWLADATAKANTGTPAELGRKIYEMRCKSCHTIDGTPLTGPTWKNLFGYTVNFADGNPPQIADENYLRSMITNPNNKIVKGAYGEPDRVFQGVMSNFQGILKDKTHDVDHLIAFIRTLSDKGAPESAPATQTATEPSTAPAATPAIP